ncbi:MAG: hypothetical protein IPH28_14005 [Cytophagaceae bacterium]|nr:hypothetical protein [Cytophagaceae bacterium]
MKRIYFLILLTLLSCDIESLDEGFDVSPVNLKIEGVDSKPVFFADGTTVITLVANIGPNAISDYTNITFKNITANSGEFEGKDKDGQRVVKTDDNGVASAKWKVPSVQGIYYVAATITGKKVIIPKKSLLKLKISTKD